jgi:serine phosphatase RsbU (regulator of sigma subunit)
LSLVLALFFYSCQFFGPELQLLNLRTSWQPFGILVPLDWISNSASLICFSVVLFGQFRSSVQRQQSIAEDLKQAQEVQQFLVPDRLPHLRGWSIESEYRPAREVGGDFFQIVPHPSDGSILIVAGDVAGKGLQAGMMVAMLVGAIRTESEHTLDPVQILSRLNRRLMGRERAQATCLAFLIQESGAATLANAGHLPPYLNGLEIDIEGSLPLGMIADAEFPVCSFDLQPGDRLVLISDGIVEAQNERGDMLGFDGVRTLLAQQVTTAEIANAAQAFGQQDDISVLSIVRMLVISEATR